MVYNIILIQMVIVIAQIAYKKLSTIIVDFFYLISYNLYEDDIMDINEIKKELEVFKNKLDDLWRSL